MNGVARRAMVIGLDGASMEILLNVVRWGHAPNLGRLLGRGVHRPMVGVFPTLTPPGWTSLYTGTWHGTHQVMDWTIRVPGQPLRVSKWGIDTRACKVPYLWNVFEDAGKTPILVKQEMSWPPTVRKGYQVEGSGPGISNYHQVCGYHLFVAGPWAPRPAGSRRDPETVDPSAGAGGDETDPVTLKPAQGWAGLPASQRPPLEVELTLRPLHRGRAILLRGRDGEPRTYYGLVYAQGQGYDTLRVCRSRNGDDALCQLSVGQWSDWWLDTFRIDGQAVEGYVRMKLITLSADGRSLEVFVPQVWPRTGFTHPPELALELDGAVGNFLQNPARDALGVVDDDTYFEVLEFHHQRLADVAQYLCGSRPWDLLVLHTHAPDYANHFFVGYADEISGAPPEVVERCRRGVTRTWESVDRMVGRLLELAGEDTLVIVASDHGGTPNVHSPVDVEDVLEQAGLLVTTGRPASQPQGPEEPGQVPWYVPFNVMGRPSREVDWSRTRAVPYGLIHIFINLKGREPDGVVEPQDYEKVQQEIIEAIMGYRHPETGECPFALALKKSDAEAINLWGDVVGDVVYAIRPEYDVVHGKHMPVGSLGIGGQHSTFVMAGPGVKRGAALERPVRVVDVMPTLCHLMGVPVPEHVEGGVIYEALEGSG